MTKLTFVSKEQIEALYPGILQMLNLGPNQDPKFHVLLEGEEMFYVDRSPAVSAKVLSVPVIDNVPFTRGTTVEKLVVNSTTEFYIEERPDLEALGYVSILMMENFHEVFLVPQGERPSGGGGAVTLAFTPDGKINGIQGRIFMETPTYNVYELTLEELGLSQQTNLCIALMDISMDGKVIEPLHAVDEPTPGEYIHQIDMTDEGPSMALIECLEDGSICLTMTQMSEDYLSLVYTVRMPYGG